MTFICKVCNEKNWKVAYEGKIRMGKVGIISDVDKTVYECTNCRSQWLPGSIEDAETYYKSDEYRYDIGENTSVKDYEKTHDPEVNDQLDVIPIESYRDKVVIDVGCGGGIFLDGIKGFAAKTAGIELNEALCRQLRDKGHASYLTADEYLRNTEDLADIVVSHSVIEHVPDPMAFIRSMKALLKPSGLLILSTPNADDYLLENGPLEYKQFFYRKVHEWYFNGESLSHMLSLAGFRKTEIRYQQNYILSNALLWLRDRKPKGLTDIVHDHTMDVLWKDYLERTGRANRVICIAST